MTSAYPLSVGNSRIGPHLSLLWKDEFPDIDTYDKLPIVIVHGGKARSVGKGISVEERKQSALGEWLERTCLYAATPERYASVRELGVGCLPPPLFGLDLEQELPASVFPFDPRRKVGWVPVTSLATEESWMHQPGWNESGFYCATSNGAAVHSSRKAALVSAVAELLERHAFVAWWYGFAGSQPLTPSMELGSWGALQCWFADRGWELTAHLLPILTRFPVVLAAAIKRSPSGAPMSAVIGLGTGAESLEPVETSATKAALEVLQAVESFSLLRSFGKSVDGDLATYLEPAGASAIQSRLLLTGGKLDIDQQWLECPIAAAQEAAIRIWISDRKSHEVTAERMHWVQVFSPDTLPFPSTGRGRRLDHPVLREHLQRSGRSFDSVPPPPHPLG